MKLRTAVLAAWDLGHMGANALPTSPHRRLIALGQIIRYAWDKRMTSRPKKIDVNQLVAAWVEAVVGMCTAHDKDEYDAHDAKADELLTPLLTAPIAQVREFYNKLRQALRNDQRVPMLVWMGFEGWGDAVIAGATDDDAMHKLQDRLAKDIADLVQPHIVDQIPKAVRRALRWRSPETLKEVKEVLETGAKPKLVGRQSCLFLETGRGKKKRQVML